MRHFDQYEVFKVLAIPTPDRQFIKDLFEKYGIASKITDKINARNIIDARVAIYLMIQGVCEYKTDFWNDFDDEYGTKFLYEFEDGVLRFFYDASDCSICLSISLVNAWHSFNDELKCALMELQEYPQKLCAGCRDARAKKLTKS
jgi:hypothetical protein